MAAPVIPCDSCGSPIPDSDLETGTAITLLGKRYCVGCKTEAIQGVSLDDLGGGRAAAPPKPSPPRAAAPKPAPSKAPPAPKPAPKAPAPPPAAAAPERKATPPRRPAPAPATPAAPARSRTPLVIGAAAAAAVLAIVAAVVLTRTPSPGPSSAGGTTKQGSGTETAPSATPQDRDALARAAYVKVDDLAHRAGASWDHVLAAIDKAKPACKGTAWEKKLEELRLRAVSEKESEEAARELSPLIDELRGAVATDPEFKRFAELRDKFQLALEMAGKTGSVKMPEIRALQSDYKSKYEKLAEPHFQDIHEAATQLADERRYDDALRKINTFPQHLRLSGAWITLDKLRQDIERRKKDAPPKKK